MNVIMFMHRGQEFQVKLLNSFAKILKTNLKTCFHKIMQRLPQKRMIDFTI